MDEHNPPMMLPNGNVYGENVSYVETSSFQDMAMEDCVKGDSMQVFAKMYRVSINPFNPGRAIWSNSIH